MIITNGTILPTGKLLRTLETTKRVKVIFSNYGALSTKMREAVQILSDNGVLVAVEQDKDLSLDRNTMWLDYGELKRYNHSKNELEEMFKACADARICRSLLKNCLYICNRIAHGVNQGRIPHNLENTELILDKVSTKNKTKDEIRDVCMSFLSLDNIPEACDFCNRGAGVLGERAVQYDAMHK